MTVPTPDDLYGLPLEQFVPARAALAKELRNARRREEASRVAALRKPSVAAWAVNQLVRTHAGTIAELFAAGDQLERAQEELLAGSRNPGELRAATVRERELVEQLTAAAADHLSRAGRAPSASTLGLVSETLHAAALQAHPREAVRAGCLERELRHVGLGPDLAVNEAPEPIGKERAVQEHAAQERAAQERERERRLAGARQAEAQAGRHVADAERAVDAAERRRGRAAEVLRDAEAVLASAHEHAEMARAAHRAAQHELEEAERPAASRARSG